MTNKATAKGMDGQIYWHITPSLSNTN